jgi:hypothetical protein
MADIKSVSSETITARSDLSRYAAMETGCCTRQSQRYCSHITLRGLTAQNVRCGKP